MNQSTVKKITVAIPALAVIATLWIVWPQNHLASNVPKNNFSKDDGFKGRSHNASADKRNNIQNSARAKDLEILKKRWKDIRPGLRTGVFTAEHHELAKESIDMLMCSTETLKLIKFLEANGMGMGITLINDQVSLLFRSSRADEARAMLVDLRERQEPLTLSYRQTWSYDAGRGCSDSELDFFRSALGDEACSLNALLGRNLELASSNPQKAIASTLEALAGGIRSSEVLVGIKDQIQKLPPDANFEEIEQSFPVENGDDKLSTSPIHVGRVQLLGQWAVSDPAAASNYVMAHPERMGPEIITVIAETVMRSDPLVGLEWVQNFPDGPYFDAAAYAAIPHISDNYPDESLKLASLIEDPKLRQRSIELLGAKQKRRQTQGFAK